MFNKLKVDSINKSKVKSYFIYAIGEIILVVAGILIALQVNNSNLISLKKQQEVKILKEINEAFISDTVNLNYFSQRIKYNTETVGKLIQVLASDQEYHDSLDHYFAMVVTPFMWSESNSAYKTLLAKGVDMVSNQEVRNDIISIHTAHYETLKYLDNGVYVKYPYIHEYCLKHFDKVGSEAVDSLGGYGPAKMKPNNYEELKLDSEYLAILKTVKSQQEVFLSILSFTRMQLKATIEKIQKEIELSEK